MSYVDKKFCFNCKLDIEQLRNKEENRPKKCSDCTFCINCNKEQLPKKEKSLLFNCSVCKIAQYCGTDCQRKHFKDHKFLCQEIYKRNRDLAAKAKKYLKENGHDVNMSVLKDFYEKNDTIFQCLKDVDFGFFFAYTINPAIPQLKHPIEKGLEEFVDMGQVFLTYQHCKPMSAKMLSEIARVNESYRGTQIALDAYLEVIMVLQPYRMYLRALVPLLMIQLGKDDEAYNFIKFWLKNTRKDFFFTVGEDGLFPQLPFTEITMKDQDKNEDLFKVCESAGSEKPYFLHFPFYVCLAIIKMNNYYETKDENQKKQFVYCIEYIKTHYKHLLRYCLETMEVPNNLRQKPKIDASFGLQKGLFSLESVEEFAEDFIKNFMGDLNFYFNRLPEQLLIFFVVTALK